jgi:membrane protease YdiL (CAAX protease family)
VRGVPACCFAPPLALGSVEAMSHPIHPASPTPGSAGPPLGGPAPGRSDAADPTPPRPPWPPWMAPVALVAAIVFAAIGALIIDIPAVALGAKIRGSHVPPGLEIADTAVQDLAFVVVACFVAQLGGRRVSAWQFGLRPTSPWRALGLVFGTALAFLAFLLIWSALVHTSKEKLLEQLGTQESTLLLVLSAALTCVIAPVCEEFLFRGFIFGSLRNWRGPWPAAILTGILFGGVHAGSAPAADLVPLAMLGVLLCLLYERTGSLYPCIGLHALNNSIAFGSLEGWSVLGVLALVIAALGSIGLLALALIRRGVISREPPVAGPDLLAISAGG